MKSCLTEGKDPPHATGLIVSRSHCVIGGEGRKIVSSVGDVERWRRSYVFGGRNAERVVDSHFPLVQGCDGECGLALRLWNARPFMIDDGTTRDFEEPR